ncbi:hypothetical protein ACWDXV_32455 [Nocardia nova]
MSQEDVNTERQDNPYRPIIGDEDPDVVVPIASQIRYACDDFFRRMQDDPIRLEDGPEEIPADLWTWFDIWLGFERCRIFSGADYPWLNPARAEDIWHEFLQLVPTIFAVIVDALWKDPTKMDYVERDPETRQETKRLPRRVGEILPSFRLEGVAHGELTPILELIAGAQGSWPMVGFHSPAHRGHIEKSGPVYRFYE